MVLGAGVFNPLRSHDVEIKGATIFDNVTLMCASGQKTTTVTKLSLKMAQNKPNVSKSGKVKFALSDGWQRDLVEFSVR